MDPHEGCSFHGQESIPVPPFRSQSPAHRSTISILRRSFWLRSMPRLTVGPRMAKPFSKLIHASAEHSRWRCCPLVARYQGSRLTGWIETKLDGCLGLEIKREKTRVVNLKEGGASLDFLGFTFRHHEDLQGRGWRYVNVSPSAQALKKEREKLHGMTSHRQCLSRSRN